MIQLNNENKFQEIDFLDTFIGLVDGSKCKTIDAFYKEISLALQFPDYFGENLDALDDMLSDLGWIYQTAIILIITNYKDLLAFESAELQKELTNLLSTINQECFEIIVIDKS